MKGLGTGSILAGRYRLVSVLGQGGMGSVWRAQHLTLDSPVAVKLIDPAIALEPEALERFMREAQAAAALRSPHVVQTLDYGVHERIPYIAMELMEGESLAQRLSRVGCLSPAGTATVLTHIARAVGKAHDLGIVHRDLKPDNVFLVRNDDEEIAKVLDFGIAKLTRVSLEATSQTRTGALLGTPYYMSPEQAEGVRTIDHRSDLWAMGVIAFECLLGQRPFRGNSIGDLVLRICSKPMPVPSACGRVPAGFDAWFAKACARDPEQRFRSVRELVEAFRRLTLGTGAELAGREGAAPPAIGQLAATTSSPVFRAQSPPARRKSRAVWMGLATAGVVAAGVGASLWFAGEGSPRMPATATSRAAPPRVELSAARSPAAPVVEPEAPSSSPSALPVAVAARAREPRAIEAPRASKPTKVQPARTAAAEPALAPPAPSAAQPRPSREPEDEPTDFGF